MYLPVYAPTTVASPNPGLWLDRRSAANALQYHRQAFGVPDSPLLSLFESLIRTLPHCAIEYSWKIDKVATHIERFFTWIAGGDPGQCLLSALGFLQAVQIERRAQLDFGLYRRVIRDDFDPRRISRVAVGIDVRDREQDCRVKLFLVLNGDPVTRDRTLEICGGCDGLRELIIHDELLIGFDFFLDGRSGLKIYPDIRQDELRRFDVQRLLTARFPRTVLEAFQASYWVHFRARDDAPVLEVHCHPGDPDEFLRRFAPLPEARRFHDAYRFRRIADFGITLRADELERGTVENCGLYAVIQ